MEAKELIEKLSDTIKEYGGVDRFLGFDELNQSKLEEWKNHSSYPISAEEAAKTQKVLDTVGPFKKVNEERTGSDMDLMEYVFHFTDSNIYLRTYGSYDSWNGVSFYGELSWQQVKPRQIMTTIYEVVS